MLRRFTVLGVFLVGSLLQLPANAQSPHQPAIIAATIDTKSLPFDPGDARAIVLFFIASDCPISDRQLPEMLRIEREFATRQVQFWFVYPNSTETPQLIQSHRARYSIGRNTRTDPHGLLAKLTGANTTPEAALLIPTGYAVKTVYTGRIDDRYLAIGTERPTAFHHDLEAAVTAALANQPIPPPGGPPVGCAFMNLASR